MIKRILFALALTLLAATFWGKSEEFKTPSQSELYPVGGTISFLSVETFRRSREPYAVTIYLDEGTKRTVVTSHDLTMIGHLQVGQTAHGQVAIQNDQNVLWAIETSAGLKRSFQDTVHLTVSRGDRANLSYRVAAIFAVFCIGLIVLRGKTGAA